MSWGTQRSCRISSSDEKDSPRVAVLYSVSLSFLESLKKSLRWFYGFRT